MRLLKHYPIYPMKKTNRRFIVVAVGLILITGFLLPPLPKARRHVTHIQSVNSLASVSFPLSTNMFASQKSKVP